MAPFAQTGGLGDVLGSLPKEIAKLGHRVSVFLPKYRKITSERFALELVLDSVHIPMGADVETARVYSCRFEDVTVFFVDHAEYFDREELYGTPMGDYPDNDRRFTFFQRAVLEALKRLKIKPDIIHGHDWQTGLISVYLKTLYQGDPFFKKTKSVFTVHNLAYQGNFPPDSMSMTGFSWNEFRFDRLEFYGKISFLKGGLVYSDILTTVSERYAKEIQTKEMGSGLDGVLAQRKGDLVGIVNGIDPKDWDPETDSEIGANYSARDLRNKSLCKAALQKEHRLVQDAAIPVFGFVGRFVDQKGLDILIPVLESVTQENWHVVLLGTGEEKYHKHLRELGARYPAHLGLNITFNPRLAKQIYAGSDIFLLPSHYEPCGLGQMISFRFGTVPLARETGGLADTVSEFNPKTGKGNGFSFSRYSPDELLKTMRRAAGLYQNKEAWTKLMKNGMACDFSWEASAREYVALYERVERKPLQV